MNSTKPQTICKVTLLPEYKQQTEGHVQSFNFIFLCFKLSLMQPPERQTLMSHFFLMNI